MQLSGTGALAGALRWLGLDLSNSLACVHVPVCLDFLVENPFNFKMVLFCALIGVLQIMWQVVQFVQLLTACADVVGWCSWVLGRFHFQDEQQQLFRDVGVQTVDECAVSPTCSRCFGYNYGAKVAPKLSDIYIMDADQSHYKVHFTMSCGQMKGREPTFHRQICTTCADRILKSFGRLR